MLADITHARERRKRELIEHKLRSGLCVKARTLRPQYGEVCFFELEFKNPFSSERVFVDTRQIYSDTL